MDYFFVGYDPGLTSAVALVDLNGNLAAVKSGRGLKESDVIGFVRAFGKPVFVCADKTPAPAAVEKLAAIFEAGVFAPKKPLSVEGKQALCRELAVENAHERDAAAAALNAYNFYINKIRNLKKKFTDEQTAKILQGRPQEEPKEKEVGVEKGRKTDVPALLRQVKIIEEDRKRLAEKARLLEEKLAECEKRAEAPTRAEEKNADKAAAEKNRVIRELRQAAARTESVLAEERKNKKTIAKYYELALEGKKPVKIIEELSEHAVLALERSVGIAKGDVLLVKKPGGGKKPVEMLARHEISAIIVKGLPDEVVGLLEEKKVKTYAPEHVKLGYENGIAFVEKYEKTEEVEIEGIIRSYRESRGSAQAD